jgi:hypothetical protein
MKLKTFNTTNVTSNRSFSPSIGVNSKTGLFNINPSACEKIGLKEGTCVQFHQDEDDPENWYLEIVKDNGFTLRKNENITKGTFLNCSYIARKIFDSVGYIEMSGRLKIGETVTIGKRDLVTLITAGLRNK